ncbi:hypothetical protein J7F03_03530 [Streptomyces sp. ISL-43]|uniref:hypothetical protein n=1 Tax=Streptomyces sp. ISL-43 TaxID=2819183 RepID=UPI001BE74790|nr:hypothetical protein [Streptomyces sp. ISL-43]MBT2446178.1 hypothetical protein [Streptomyces sp. ISL-43]
MHPRTKRTLHATLLAAALALSFAPYAGAAPAPQPPASSADFGTPPAGYVHETSFYGTAAACQTAGKAGIAEGRWTAYFCYQALPFTPFQELYVKL